ncbi:hypothetical protein TRFO_05492 [Tritrichomonas foetus]|uniref:Beige/BEACH domain containing protein n=1 Tax=Tritrichomonas foetus TaxID=1144522 RepID=A0A1J4K5V6_9EUKA|nr:hypothetical protein TRFO_05492 [Tritrichomonas foetus]|eukprot:OHT06791.1 hypothetical protein TRFO_05492 [Tritrichomonas foetus]
MASTPPIIEILQFFTTKPRIPNDRSPFSILVQNCNFPVLECSLIKSISETLSSKSSIVDAIEPISNNFFFSAYELETLHQIVSFNESQKKIAMIIVFSNSIAFLFQEFNEFYIKNLTDILLSLIRITKSLTKRLTTFMYLTVLENAIDSVTDNFPISLIRLICSHVDQFMSNLPAALNSIVRILRENSDENAVPVIYLTIQKLLTVFLKENIDFDDSNLAKAIRKRIFELEPESLNLLFLLGKNRQSKNVSYLYSTLPKACSELSSDFDENQELFCKPCEFEYSKWKSKYKNIASINYIIDNLNIEFPSPDIDKQQTTGSYLPPIYRKQLKNLLTVLNEIHYSHINAFFLAYAKLLKKKGGLKNYLALMYFITHIKFYHDIEEPVFEALLSDSLFTPSVTLFNCYENFEATSFYRERVIMIAYVHAPNLFSKMFKEFKNYPFLFAELVIRVLNHLPNVIPRSLCTQSTLKSLFTVQKRLQKISFFMDEDKREIAVGARSAVFTLIFNIFLNPLPSELVLESFLDSLEDKSFSDSLFARINQGLQISNCIFLKNAFNILSHLKPPEIIIEVLMNYTSQAILHEPEATSTVLLSLFDFLDTNPNQSILELTLEIIILMFSKTHHCYFVKGVFSKLSEIIPKVNLRCFDQLFSMLSMLNDTKVGSLFLITNPNMLVTVFSVFMNYEEYDLLLSEMLKLCDYSSYNRYQLYEGEIDLLLLEMIYNYPNNFNFRSNFMKNIKDEDKLFDFTIPLFLRASVTRSSEVVVEKMIKIIAPRENGRFAPIALNFLKRITPLKDKLNPIYTMSYPLGLTPPLFDISEIPFNEFTKGSSILFWLYVDEFLSSKLTIKSTVFKIDIPKFTFLEVFVSNATLYCSYHRDSVLKTETILKQIPTNQWCLIGLRFRMVYKSVEMSIQLNDKSSSYVVNISLKHTKAEYAKFTVGNSTRFHGNQGLLSCIYQLDAFYYYNVRVTESEFATIYADRLSYPYLKFDPVFSHPMVAIYDQKKKVNITSDNRNSQSLLNICRYFYPIERYVQIFEYYDLCISEYSVALIKGAKGLFGSAIIKIFNVLPYFLTKTKQPLLYEHYLALFDFLSECSNEKEMHSLLDNLIVNFHIWIQADQHELKKIIEHCCSSLFRACASYFTQESFFSKLIGIIRMFLSTAENLEFSTKRYHNFDPTIFIPYFDNLMIERSKRVMSSYDIDLILETILRSPDQFLVQHLLELYPQLIVFTVPTHHHLILLLLLDLQKNYRLFPLLIRALIVTNEDFYSSIVLMGYRIKEPFWYDDFLNDVRDFPHTFSFSIIVALQGSEENQNDLADLLLSFSKSNKSHSTIKSCKFWMIWPLVFALQAPPAIQHKLSLFIAQMTLKTYDQDSLDDILIFLKILQATTSFNTIPVQTFILTKIFDTRSILYDSKDLDLLGRRFFLTMYTKFNFNPISNELMELISESQFSEMKLKPIQKVSRIQSMKELFDALHVTDKRDFIYHISLQPCDPELRRISHDISSRLKSTNKFSKIFKLVESYVENKESDLLLSIRKIHKLFHYFDKTILPFLTTIKEVTSARRVELNKYFGQFKEPIRELYSTIIEDPLIPFKNEFVKNLENAKQLGQNIIRDFTPLCNTSDESSKPKWRRMFTFSSDFNSAILKKARKYKKEDRKYQVKAKLSKVISQFPCKKVTIKTLKAATLYIFKTQIIIDITNEHRIYVKTSSLRYILTRNRLQKPTAIEFFTTEGHSYLLDFAPLYASQVLNVFQHIRMKNLIEREDSDYSKFISQNGLVKRWEKGEITNFEFLLRLNMYTGRSLMDPQNGIIFPWVSLSDNKRRDLSMPLTSQDSSRFSHFLQLLDMNGYMFGTAPSNAMLLAYYFVRTEPYTQLHIKIHDGHFDVPERMFKNIPTFFQTQMTSDEWKEATPEFYCFPEMFMDLNNKDIGNLVISNQNNETIFDFVYNNRKMLESEYVSLHLGEWVSLLWGIDQNNLFMPYLYKSAWTNENCSKEVIPTMLSNLGSIPQKVFDSFLPKRILQIQKCSFDKLISLKIPKARASRNAFLFEKNGLPRVIICFDDGTIQRFGVNSLEKRDIEPVYLAPLKLKIPSDAKFVMERETVFVFDEKSERVHCVNFEQLKTVNTKIASIDFAMGGTNFGDIITATKSGVVKYWRFPEFIPMHLFTISVESISAVAMNQQYGIFVCAANDGYLRTYSIEQKRLINEIKLGCIIEKIITTQGLGFIVLYTPGYLYLFSVNAFLIKKVPIDFEVYQWTTFKDQSGFDFICCADPIGHIYVFEAYKLENVTQIAACHERIISVKYIQSLKAIAAYASSSTLYFVPYK